MFENEIERTDWGLWRTRLVKFSILETIQHNQFASLELLNAQLLMLVPSEGIIFVTFVSLLFK